MRMPSQMEIISSFRLTDRLNGIKRPRPMSAREVAKANNSSVERLPTLLLIPSSTTAVTPQSVSYALGLCGSGPGHNRSHSSIDQSWLCKCKPTFMGLAGYIHRRHSSLLNALNILAGWQKFVKLTMRSQLFDGTERCTLIRLLPLAHH